MVRSTLSAGDHAQGDRFTGPRESRRGAPTLARGTVLAERFEVRDEIGAGGMGRVYAAVDHATGRPVALKLLGELGPETTALLKREFRAASDLSHPNLVRLYGLHADGPRWFIAMERIDGASLTPDDPSWRAPGYPELRRIFGELSAALGALHAQGTLHGDVKPSNFLVERRSGRVVLLDFGLSRAPGGEPDACAAGTPAYMAPELLQGDSPTEAADWYSFGVLLHEALTGELPSRRIRARRGNDAPADLMALARALLSPRPEERPGLREVQAVLGAPPGPRSELPGRLSARSGLVGREPELAALAGVFAEARAGAPRLARVVGPAGVGKSALVATFLDDARRAGATVLVSRCREREAMGFKAVDGLVDALLAELRDAHGDAAPELPADLSALTVLFPGLAADPRLAARAGAPPTADQFALRGRAVQEFGELLQGLSRRGPVVLHVDDTQWSDAESAVLLGPLVDARGGLPLLLVASHRPDAGSGGPLLAALEGDPTLRLHPGTTVTLAPLDAAASSALAARLLPEDAPDPGALGAMLARESGGSPLLLRELVLAARAPDGSYLAPAERTLARLLSSRVAALPELARGVLELAAVAGAPIARRTLYATSGCSRRELEESLDHLRAARLLAAVKIDDRAGADVLHDRIRETVVAELPPARLRELHRALGAALSEDPHASPERVGHHLEGAGEPVRAAAHLLVAARRAVSTLAFAHAAGLFARALALAPHPPAERRRILRERAEALALAGSGPAAAEAYLELARDAEELEALELRRLAAEQWFTAGDLTRGIELIDPVLRALALGPVLRGPAALAAAAAGRAGLGLRGFGHRRRTEAALSPRERLRVDAAWTLSRTLSVQDFLSGADFQTRHLLLALRAGEPRRLLRALTLEISYAATPGAGAEAKTAGLIALAEELARDVGGAEAAALLSTTRGVAAYCMGDLPQAVALCREAGAIIERDCRGMQWEQTTARRFLIASLFLLGRVGELAATVPQLTHDAEAAGNRYAGFSYRAYGIAAWLVRDDVEGARREIELARRSCRPGLVALPDYNVLVAECLVDLYEGRRDRARARLDALEGPLSRAGILRIGVLRVQIAHLRGSTAADAAGVARAAAVLGGDPNPRAPGLHALLEAELALAAGHTARAAGRLEVAAQRFERLGHALYAAASRARRAALTPGPQGARLREAAWAAFSEQGVARPDRFVDMLAPGLEPQATAPGRRDR